MNTKLWKQLEYGVVDSNLYGGSQSGLHDISESRLGKRIPEISLWLAVLIDAAKHNDVLFLKMFGKRVCELAKLDHNVVFKSFNMIWEKENAAVKVK